MDKHKKRRLWLGIGVGLMTPIAAMLLSINVILRHALTIKIDRAIAEADSLYVTYGSIELDIVKGKIAIYNVAFQSDTIFDDSKREFSRLELAKVGLDGVNYYSLFIKKEIDLIGITIDGVSYRGILDTKAMEARAAADDINKATREQFEKLLREAQKHLNRVTLKRLTIGNASAEISALETGLHLIVDNIGFEINDLGYSLVDSIPFHVNDSAAVVLNVRSVNMVMPDSAMNLSIHNVWTDNSRNGLVIEGVRFATDKEPRTMDQELWTEYHEVMVDTIRLDSIDLPDMKEKNGINVGVLRVVNARYFGLIDDTKDKELRTKDKGLKNIDFAALGVKTEEGQMLAMLKKKQEKAMTEQQMKMLKLAQEWLDEVKIDRISIENTSVEISSLKTHLAVGANDINASFNDLGYSLIDSIPYHFNDSIYSISFESASVTTPDGFIKIECNGFEHSDCGPISIGQTHIYHNVDKWRLSHLMGNVSTTWIDLTVDTFYTSRVSPFSTVIDRHLMLDSVFVRVSNLDLFVDNRVLTMPKFEMPSKETLLEIKRLFEIDNIIAIVDNLRTEVTGHYSNNGIINIQNASLSFNDIYFNNLNVGHFDALFPDGTLNLSIGNIHTQHAQHNLVVKDVTFSTVDGETSGSEPYHIVKVDSVVVGGVALDNAYTSKNLAASVLRIVHPQYTGRVNIQTKDESQRLEEKKLKAEDPIEQKRKAIEKAQSKNMMEFLQEWLAYAQMQKIQIERASADISALNSGFSLKTHDFDLSLSGIGFDIDNFIPINVEDSLIDLKYFMSNFRLIGNSAISNIGFKDLHATLPDSSMYLNVKKVYTDYASSSVIIDNLEFATDTIVPEDEMFHKVTVDTLRLDGIVLPDLKSQREATAGALRIIRPHYFGLIDESEKTDTIRESEKDNSRTKDPHNIEKQKKAFNIIGQFFDGVALDRVSIEDASAEFSSLVSNLYGKAEGLDLSLNNISYELSDVVYDIEQVPGLSFNDSTYSVRLRHADVMIPDSTMFISLNNFVHENCGPVSLGHTAMNHTIDKWEIAHRNGDIPTTWFSMVLDTFRTSFVRPMNFFKNFKEMGKVSLDSVIAVVDTLTIFRDMRYKPKVPYTMPQVPMLKIDSSLTSIFSIKAIDARVNRMNVSMAMADNCVPFIGLNDIWGNVSDVSLAKGANIKVVGGASIGSGSALVEANIGVRPECPWDIKLQATGIDLSFLNEMVFPIAGMNVSGIVHELKAEYGGDSIKAEGVMRMTYNDLQARFFKESPSPYKFLSKNYRFLNSAAKTLIAHNNPSKASKKARAYKVSWKNDPWSPSAMFMLGPMIKGAIESLLPGIFVGNKIKDAQF